MRRVSEHYGAVARDLETVSGYVIELIPIVKNDFDGEAADSFLMAMKDLAGQTAGANQLEQTAELSRQLSEVALKVANQVEYTKIMAILQLVQLLAEILFATLFSAFTFGSVWGPVSALFAATREGLHQLFRWLLQTIISQTFIGIVGGVFQDTVIQLYQLGAGHTTSWNTESLIDSIKQGALSGVVAGPLEIFSHYGGKLLGRVLGGKTPGSIISKRIDDVLNKVDDKLDHITPNPKPDIPTGGAGPKSKLDDIASKSDKELPPTPPDKAPNDVTPPPAPPKTVTEGTMPAPVPAPSKAKPEAPGGATAKDKPNAPATGTKTRAEETPTAGAKTGAQETPTPGGKGIPGADRTEIPNTGRAETPTGKPDTVGGKDAPGAGRPDAGDASAGGKAAKSSDSSAAGRTAGDVETPLDDLLPTKEARSAFAKDVGELLGGVSRNLETGFLRHGEGTIADSFTKKMGDVFSEHLGQAGAREAGEAFGEMLTRKWVRLGADHTELPELLTKAMGDFGQLAPLKNLADSMPNLFARSEHSNALARIFKQENPLQGSPMYQLGGAVASLLNEGTNEMLSEGFYNMIFGDGTFEVSGGPFASGVAMGALSHGLHRAFEPITVRYQNWVLSHQHADNPADSKYFGLLHPINIASFVSNMTGNPAPWPVPRPTSELQETSFLRDMKDMVEWVFSHPVTGTPFFTDLPQRSDVTVESGGAFTPLDLDLGPSFGDEIARDPLFRSESDDDALTNDGGTEEGDEGSGTAAKSSRATVSSDLSALLGDDTEGPVPDLTDQDRPATRPVTQGSGDRFSTPVPQETGSPARTEVPAQAEAAPSPRPHPLQAEKDRAAAEGLDYLLPYDSAYDDTTSSDDAMTPVGDGDSGDHAADDGDRAGDGTAPRPGGAVRDIPSGIAVGVLTPAQAAVLRSLPQRSGVFVVGMHTDPRTPHDPGAVLKALTDAHDGGRLDGITEIRFTACGLASPVHESTVRTVMSGLWKHRAVTGTTTPDPLMARAADAPVWYVPTTGGHLLTAQHVGLTPDGKIAVVDEGAWHVYGDSGDRDHTPVRTTPDADDLPDDAVRFLFRTPAVDAEHPDAVTFGRDKDLPVALSRHLPRERWTALLSDPAATDLLAEVTETRRSPDDAWHTMDAGTYLELQNQLLGEKGNGFSDETVENAFSVYPPELSADGAERLEAVVNLVRELHADTEEGPLTPAVQILLQRLLLDQGFPPARLPDAARTTTLWKENETGFLAAELTLGMADVTGARNTPLTGELTGAPAATPSDEALSELLQDPDESRKALLRELLDGAHLPDSPWHTLDGEAYLALRSRVEGSPLGDPGTQVRETLHRVFEEYGEALKRATTRVDQLKAVADTVLTLHATGGLTGSPESALTAHSRFLVPRMLLDLGITPVPLPAKLHAKPAWQAPRNAKMRNTRILTFATSVARAVTDAHPSWSRPLTFAPAEDDAPGVTPSGDRATDTGTGTGAPASSSAPVATHAPAPQTSPARDGDGDGDAPEPTDWRAELDALGTRTREETTAFLVLPEPAPALVGRADRLLRTDDRPYTTLTKDLPPGTEHWLVVQVPAGHAVDTGEGRLLVGKDRLAAVTLTGPADTIGSLQDLERGLRPPGSPEQPLPLAVLSRVGQALYANPDHDEHHTVVRTAVRVAYAEASRDAERALGEYLTRREDVQRQVRDLVRAAWDKLSADERRRLGTAQNAGSGSVGDDLTTLEEVVENGNIRERMHLLVTGVHGPVREHLGLEKPKPEILTRERSADSVPEAQRIQQDADVVQNIKREQERLRAQEADNPGLEALLRAQPGGRFPDEVALGLEAHERTPDVLASPPPVRRTLRALPDSELKALLDRTPGLTDRAAGLLREALGDGGNTSRDWRRLNADSYLDLRERVTRPDDAVQDPQTGVWGELDSIMERWYGLEQDVPPPDPQRQSLDSAFDDYYAALAGDPGDRTRLTALAELLLRLREAESPPSSDTDVPTALGVVAQRLLVDQGYPPALWGEAVGAPDFWPNDAPSLVRKLEAAIGEFTHHRPVRQTPTGIAVGPMNAAQSRVLGSLPPNSGVFVVGMHTDPRTPHDPGAVLKALTDAHDGGRLDGITEIRFTACGLASPVHESTVRTVMSGLWKHRAVTGTTTPDPLTARAADAPVWYVPTTGGHLLTAQHIGLTPDGKIAVVDEGAWHVYGDSGDRDRTPVRTTPDADDLPDDTVRESVAGAEHPDAVTFGQDRQTPLDNGEGSSSSSHHASTQAPPGGGPPAWAQDASIDDLVMIRYMEESEAYERRLADHLFRLQPVRDIAQLLARTVLDQLRDTPLHGRLGVNSPSTPGAVGLDPLEWERVVRTGNTREQMTLLFSAIASGALPARLGAPAGYPQSIQEERKQRGENPDAKEYSDLDKRRRAMGTAEWNAPEHARLNERWRALDSVLRPFKAEEVKPPLSSTERNLAVDDRGMMRWNPGGSSLTIEMGQPFQRGAEQAGRLVRSGTSGSAYYFHRYAQLMADRWGLRIDHRNLRLAIIATFVSEGHHSLPEVLAGSSAFAERYGERESYRARRDIRPLLVPVREPSPNWDHYRDLAPLSEDQLRRYVARGKLFPHEIAENYRSELAERRERNARRGSEEDSRDPGDMDVDTPAVKRSFPFDGNGSDGDGDVDMQSKRRRPGDSPNVPEGSPHTLPGQLRPEEVSPADRPITADRWSAWRWTPGRQDVPPPAPVRTERFDPAADPHATGPFPGTADRRNDDGTLAGRRTLISADVQRFTVPPDGNGAPGGTVRLVQVTLPVAVDDTYSAADVAALRDRLQGLLDTHVNLGFRLPRGRDQLHMEVRLDPMSVPRDGAVGEDWVRVSRDAGPGNRSDQLRFRLHADDSDPHVRSRDDAMLLHELLHYVGLPDRYHDAETLFRHSPGRADASGVMATTVLPDGTLPRRYLEAVEDVTESGSVLHDNDGPGTWTAARPGGAVRDIPSGIAVGVLTPAQAAVLRSLPQRSGVFVVGMHTDPRTPHDPGAVLKALTDAHDGGRLDSITEIRFTACGLASPVHESTVRTVMSGLWKHRAVTGTTTPDPLTARAADAPVWYVPTTGGHLLTAQHIGLTLDGKIAVVDEGAWHVYGDSGDRDHTPARTTPDADDLPDDTVRFLFRTPAVDAEHPDAVTFGQDRQTPFDNGEGSSSSQRQQTPLASSSETSTPPAPRAPWYVDGGKALGDGRVLSVSGPAQVTEALHEARTDLTKAGVDAETAAKVMKRLTPVLSSTDPGAWNDFLRDGTVFHANGRVVVVTARPDGLTHHTAQPKEQLAPYASRNQAVTNRAVSAGGNLSAAGGVDAVVKLANMTDVTGTIPSVKVQAGTTYAASRTATADTQGAGRTVLNEMHEFDGGVRVEVHVLDKDTTREREAEFAFPRRLRLALPEGTGASGDATTWKVVAPEALKSVLSTVNAIAPGPLLTGLASAMGRAGFTPDVTAAFVSKVATDFFNEKALKDGNQWWSTGSLTSGVFAAGGFPKKSLSGHFLVGAELTGLRRMDLTSGRLRVREDFSDAFGVKSSSRFGDKSGLTVGVSFLTNPDGPVVVPSVELAVNAARSHNFDVGGSDKTKVKLTHTEEEQVEYHATARFRVKFMSSSKRTALSFDSALDLAVGVPRSQAEAFEAGLLGPGRTELVPDPPRPDTPGTPPPSRFRAVGQAVRRLLRLARQEPSANFDVDAARPFPSRGMPDPAGLLEIAGRHPIEIAPSNGTLPDGAVWTSLRDHPRVVVVPATAVYSLAGATAPEAAFRYHVNALGEVTAAQRLRTSTFTELFGPLEPGDTGIARLTELSADRPWLGFTVRDDAGILLRIPAPPRAGALSLTVRKGDGGELDVQSALRHPVEQTVRDLAATDAAAEQPAQVLTDIMSELEDLAVRQRPLEVRIDERYEGFDTLTGRLAGHPHLLFREDTDPRRPAAYMMRVDGNGALSGPFRRRDFGSDPLEPPALASRTGLGPGVVGELPGSQKVLETALDWLDRHLERTGLKKRLNEVEYAQFHRELTAAFGATGMRARFPKLLGSGVPLVLKAGGQELRLHLRSELLDLRGAPVKSDLSLTRSVTRSANQTVGVGDQVSVSATVGGTLRFDTREGQRAEPGGKIGLGGTPSHVKDSVAATLKASREQETSGQHTVFTYTAVHHLTATVHDFRGNQVSGSSLRVEGEDVSAVVRVGDDHLANDSTAHRLSTGTVTEFSRSDDPSWLGASDPREFVLPRDGLGGIHPEFLSTRLLTGSVVTLVAGHGGARTPKPADEEFDRHSGDAVGAWRRGLTPELEEALTPNFLQSRFEQLTSPDGAVFPLPPDSSGHAQALVVRLRLGRPEHEGTGTGTSLTYTAETGTKSSTSRTRSFTYVGGLSIGGYASLAGKSVAATVSAEATRTRTKARTVASAGTGTSTATYKGTSHHYRADAYYEIIHHTWQPDGRFSTTPSDHSTGKLYVKVDGGVELTVPDHHARVLEMPGTGPRPAVSHGPRSYVDADLAKAVSHVEKLGADDVLTEIKNLFGTLKGIPDHLGGGAPTDFSRALETVFSPEALRADFAALSTTSVHQVIKLRQPGGGARMIGIQVTAEVGEPRYEGPRHQVTLAMGATATRSAASASGVSDKGGGQLSLTLRATDANGLSRGGAKIGAGADTSAGRTETVTTSERDQHSFEVTGTAREFSHPVSYTVKIFDASEPHQLIRLAGAALNSPAQLIDRATDGRAGRWFAEQWGGEWEKVFPSGHKPAGTRTIADREVRLLVPDHLTRPGATAPAPAEPVGRVRPKGPTAVTPEVQRLTEDLAPSVRALSLPGLGAVVKWLPTAAALPQRVTENDTGTHTREDLAPATLAGLRTDLLTTQRNLRANIRQLLGGGYTVPVAGGEEVTVRMVVRRARHLASAEFDSNAETEVRERETEREQERTTLAWSGSITPDGPVATTDSGTPAGPGVAGATTHLGVPVAIGGEQGTSLSTSRSETVDERAKKQRTQHYYTSDVTWVLTGSRRTTVEIEVDGGLIGLLHDDLIDGLAGRHDDLFQPKPAPQDEGATEHRDQGDGEGEDRNENQDRNQDGAKSAPEATRPSVVVTPPTGIGTGLSAVPGDASVPLGPTRPAPPATPPGPVPGVTITPPADTPLVPPVPVLRVTEYEAVGTVPRARRTGGARVEVLAEGADPIALALTGPPKDAASFPAYRPVRPVGPAEERPALQVSDDRRFAVPEQRGGAREFYATSDAVAEARSRLLPAAGTRLEADPESYVRFTLNGVEHTLLRVTVRGGGPGSVPLVLAGDAGGQHITLQGDPRPDRRGADMRRAVDTNLDHYGPELEAVAEKLEYADPGRAEPRTVLARALADLRRAREEGRDPTALERAEAEAVRAFGAATGDEYGSPEDDWHLRLGRPPVAVALPPVDWSF
ncbi:hypothetical protein GCM10010518_04570 [Kitasatospora cinereorecta]